MTRPTGANDQQPKLHVLAIGPASDAAAVAAVSKALAAAAPKDLAEAKPQNLQGGAAYAGRRVSQTSFEDMNRLSLLDVDCVQSL